LRIALNLSTLAPAGLEAQLAEAAAAGFRLVELRAPALAAVADLAALLRREGLETWSVNSLEGAGERDLREEARRQAAWAAECGAPYVVCVPGRKLAGLEDALLDLAAACREEGAALAFEFMGFEWSAVRTLAQAQAVYSGPVVIDSFHWALGDRDLDTLRALDPRRLAVVHVNDAPAADLRGLGDQDRLLPGRGVLDLAGFYGALSEIGYDGVYSVELFSPVSAAAAYGAMRELAR
jgi:2-keto-myo-inositol isomerase